MANSAMAPYVLAGNIPVGTCGFCDLCDSKGNLVRHVDQYTLYRCQNCNGWVCKLHLLSCGFCFGCCAEEHGLGEGH